MQILRPLIKEVQTETGNVEWMEELGSVLNDEKYWEDAAHPNETNQGRSGDHR